MSNKKQITNWKNPIWEQQDNEPDRAYFYLDKFLDFDDSLFSFSKYLARVYKDESKRSLFFIRYDIQKNKKNEKEISKKKRKVSPNYDMLKKWSRRYKWRERKLEYKNNKAREIKKVLFDKEVANIEEIFKLETENRLLVLRKQNQRLKSEDYNPYHNKADAETQKILQDSMYNDRHFDRDEFEESEDNSNTDNVDVNPTWEDPEVYNERIRAIEKLIDKRQ